MNKIVVLCCVLSGCSYVIESGHRGLYFSHASGPRHEVLQPRRYHVAPLDHIVDFDVTYSTRKEEIHTVSSEGLAMSINVALSFRPVVSELYDLDIEIGSNYYDEVVGPEFRTATRGVFARHSYLDVQKNNEKVEDEIEAEVRRRIAGKHIEISSVTLENIDYAQEIKASVRAKLVGEQEWLRGKLVVETEIRRKETDRRIAEEQARIDKVQAENEAATRLTRAKAEAEAITMLAKAHAEEKRAEATTLTPLMVQMRAYDALAKLGGSGTNLLIGDWAHVPNFLFPHLPGFSFSGGRP